MAKKIDWNAVTSQMANTGKKTYTNDNDVENLFVPKLKEDGTYDAIIRFLPSPDTDLPYVTMYTHSYKTKEGKWYIENCPQSVGKKCPACEQASKFWNSGRQEEAKDRFKKTSYYSNILIVKDPQNPDNDGKIFLFRYGKKIYEQIRSKMVPATALDEPVMVFDMEDGANYKLKIRSKSIKFADGSSKAVSNYDSSEFMNPSKVGTEEVQNDIESRLLSLKAILSPTKFKATEDLLKRLNTVEGLAVADNESEESEAPAEKAPAAKPKAKPAKVADPAEEDDEKGFFARLRGEE
jgi:hypothetical protein